MYTQQQKRKMNTEVWMAQSGLMRSYQLLLSSLLNPTSRFSDPVEAERLNRTYTLKGGGRSNHTLCGNPMEWIPEERKF